MHQHYLNDIERVSQQLVLLNEEFHGINEKLKNINKKKTLIERG